MVRWLALLPLIHLVAALPIAAEDRWGHLSGQIRFADPPEKPRHLIQRGDPAVRDSATCAAQNVPDEAIVINPKTGGVANIFVSLKKRPASIHPQLIKPPSTTVWFTAKQCRFEPHALIVRTDQQIAFSNEDPIPHNVHTYTIKNDQINYLLPRNWEAEPITVTQPHPEKLPFKVCCDIHPWMSAYWLVVDHPYAATTDAEGKFRIENLPVGDQEFVIWHETAGYLAKSQVFPIREANNTVELFWGKTYFGQ